MTDIITPGKHLASCDVIQFGETAKGGPQIAVGFTILAPSEESGGYYQTYDVDVGKGITRFGGFGECKPGKQMGQIDVTIKELRTLGWTGDDLSELPALAEARKLSAPVELVIEHETYDGKTQARIKYINPIGGGRTGVKLAKPMEADEVKALGALMKQRIRGMGGAAPTTSAPARGAVPTRGSVPPAQRSLPSHPNAPGSNHGGYGPGAPTGRSDNGDDSDIPF